jgi:signal transduction histidine kinase
MGFAYLLQQNPNTPPEIKNDVDAIYREGKRAAEVIKSFLIFARGQKPAKQAVYINDILEGVIRLRHSQMNKENIEVASNLAEDLPAVQGDISQLQQAFLNIVLNAEYFMNKAHRGGHLSLSSVLADEKVVVLIGDDGPGIPPEKLNRVFDPFYTTKDVGEGTGLGLSICHGIIREHGGDIYVESSPGKGATFIVELPVGK